ncbi:MAG: bifunctional aminoglycoside phosphotransferase/ATP-binding protein [Gaiellaceae bacterium]
MLKPALYPHAPRSVELRETHISWVFLAGDLAYKVKKPLVLPFLDYGTAERRREMCREEVRLNRRLAPRIYLRVVGLARDGERWSLTAEDDPAACEYAVEMRGVEERRSLAALAAAGTLRAEHVSATAAVLAAFHAAAPVADRERREVAVLEATLDENVVTLRDSGAGVIEQSRLDAAEHFTRAFVEARRDELEARAQGGLVRDCHGDLRAEHVIVPEHGDVYVYDCIEFNPDLRQIDVAADIAFLVMDLTRLGADSLAELLIADYRRAGGDPGDEALLFVFASYRAWVRAKVACIRAQELSGEDPELERVRAEAGELMRLGHRFAWRSRGPLVLVLCGVSGTGKTTVAHEVAAVSGWEHLSSDVTRKRLAGLDPTEPGGAGLYSRQRTIETYRELGRLAAERLDHDRGVVVDATFHLRAERDAFRDGFGERPGPLLFIECHASTETLLARVRERELKPDRVSDADTAVVEGQLAEFEPLDEVPRQWRAELRTEAQPAELVADLEAIVDATQS